MPETPASDIPSRDVGVTAGCGFCGRPLPVGARLWCSPAHRQAAYRRRHQPMPEPTVMPAARSRTEGTVYECDGCGRRFIGTQRCEECNLFARRIGTGGPCPHCDEPVAMTELVD